MIWHENTFQTMLRKVKINDLIIISKLFLEKIVQLKTKKADPSGQLTFSKIGLYYSLGV